MGSPTTSQGNTLSGVALMEHLHATGVVQGYSQEKTL